MPIPVTSPSLSVMFNVNNLIDVAKQVTRQQLLDGSIMTAAMVNAGANPSLIPLFVAYATACDSAMANGPSADIRVTIEARYHAQEFDIAERNRLFSITARGYSWRWAYLMVAQNP